MKHLICIVCPNGCHLDVDDENGFKVTGNRCPRGAEYGKTELTNPTRVLTSTVKISSAPHRRCPVKTDGPIPKGKLLEAMDVLDNVELKSPVKRGDIVINNILGTGANLIVTKDM
jgi:CxxC motif-containing protein